MRMGYSGEWLAAGGSGYVYMWRRATAGTWTWEVEQGPFGPQPLGSVKVTDANVASSSGASSTTEQRGASLAAPIALTAVTVAVAMWSVRSAMRARRGRPTVGPIGHAGT